MNLGSKLQSALESEEDLVIVTREEESVANLFQVPDPKEWSERSSTPDFKEEVQVRSHTKESSGDEMPTRLKYSRFRGDRSQDVDDWFSEFESIALANQEDLEIK